MISWSDSPLVVMPNNLVGSLLCGGISGAVGRTLTAPLSRLLTMSQTNITGGESLAAMSKRIINKEGIKVRRRGRNMDYFFFFFFFFLLGVLARKWGDAAQNRSFSCHESCHFRTAPSLDERTKLWRITCCERHFGWSSCRLIWFFYYYYSHSLLLLLI